MPKNIPVYKTRGATAGVLLPSINPKSTWKCVHVDPPHIPHPPNSYLTRERTQFKAPHERLCIEMSQLIHGSLGPIVAATQRKIRKLSHSSAEVMALVGEAELRGHVFFFFRSNIDNNSCQTAVLLQ